MSLLARAVLPCFVAGLAAVLAAFEQTQAPPPTQQQPVFRAGIDLVQVDVSVLDRSRRPVRDLLAKDFTVLENGRPQEIVAFVPINLPEFELPSAPWMRDAPADVRTNELGEGRLFAILMDDAAMPPDLQMAQSARKIGHRIIDELGPADMAAVIFSRDNRYAQDFTTDRARLRAAIDKFHPGVVYGMPGTSEISDSYSFESSIRTLNRVTEYLSTVPQRRKTVFYVSTGVPVDLEAAASVVLIGPSVEIAGTEAARDLADALRTLERTQANYAFGLRDAMVRAQHGNVNVYSIDPGGLGGLQFFLSNRTAAGRPTSSSGPINSLLRGNLHRDYLRTVAENSGGRAIVDTNDLNGAISQVFRENSTYYLIGYRSTRAEGDRRVRRVEVRVNKPDVTAQTRNAYYDPRAKPAELPADPGMRLVNALSGVLPNPDLDLRATVAPFPLPGRKEAGVAVVLGVRQPAPSGPAGGRVQETVELLTRVFSPAGDDRGSTRATAQITMRTGVADQAQFDLLSLITLSPGRYQFRLAAHSLALDRSGSVYFDVDVPDFRGDMLQLSGVVLVVTPGHFSAPAGALSSVAPFGPTSQRDFAKSDALRAFVQVYAGGKLPSAPMDLNVRLTDENDKVVYRLSEPLAANRFDANRLVPYLFDVPLARLADGRYLLTVETGIGGRSAKRDVPISVR